MRSRLPGHCPMGRVFPLEYWRRQPGYLSRVFRVFSSPPWENPAQADRAGLESKMIRRVQPKLVPCMTRVGGLNILEQQLLRNDRVFGQGYKRVKLGHF